MITSAGYDGSVNEPQWSALLSMSGGRQYGVRDAASWVASIGSGDRQLVLSEGAGFGYGVADESDESETLTLAPVSSGSRWDLIVMRRDWGANESSFEVVQGTSTVQLPERETGPADLDDQPLWLARVQAGSSQVMQLIDLRVWGGDGGALAQHELVLQYLNRLGTVVRIGDVRMSRVLDSLGNAVWRREDVTPDTGWIDITRNEGWTFSYAQVRRIGGTVFFRIVASRPVGWAQGNNLAALPVGFRPSDAWYGISSHKDGRGAEFRFDPSGAVTASAPSAGAVALNINGCYPAVS